MIESFLNVLSNDICASWYFFTYDFYLTMKQQVMILNWIHIGVDKALETKQQEEEIFNYQKMLDKREANKKAQEQLKKEQTTKYMLFFVLIAFNQQLFTSHIY